MRLTNKTITVFNTRLDQETGYDVYVPTVIDGVSWFCEVASTVDSTGLKAADRYTIRIPVDADFGGKEYVEPESYTEADPETVWTLKSGDIIVEGAVKETGLRPSDLQKMQGQIVTVLGVTDNRRARAKHWKVVGS